MKLHFNTTLCCGEQGSVDLIIVILFLAFKRHLFRKQILSIFLPISCSDLLIFSRYYFSNISNLPIFWYFTWNVWEPTFCSF